MRLKFLRQNVGKKKLKVKWRNPTGIHSKLRLNKAGHRKKPSPGFRAPKKERVAKISLIKNLNDLINAKSSILISSKLGLKKKIEVLKRAKEMKLNVLNVKNIDEFINKSNEVLEKRRQEKKKKETEKKKSKEKSVKEAKKKSEKDQEKEVQQGQTKQSVEPAEQKQK